MLKFSLAFKCVSLLIICLWCHLSTFCNFNRKLESLEVSLFAILQWSIYWVWSFHLCYRNFNSSIRGSLSHTLQNLCPLFFLGSEENIQEVGPRCWYPRVPWFQILIVFIYLAYVAKMFQISYALLFFLQHPNGWGIYHLTFPTTSSFSVNIIVELFEIPVTN